MLYKVQIFYFANSKEVANIPKIQLRQKSTFCLNTHIDCWNLDPI